MSVIHNDLLLATDEATGYNLTKSLRFRSSASASLTRTYGTPTNSKLWSFSAWIKRGKLGATQEILNGNSSASQFYFQSNDTLNFYDATSGAEYITTQVFRDPSAWYHIVVAMDTTQATSGNRTKIYVNGSQVTSFGTATAATQNTNSAFNVASTLFALGVYYPTPSNYFDGYMANVQFIDGQQLTPSSFGENDTITGVWKPKAYTGTYGTNGFYLPFTDVATTSGSNAGLGKDFSGNGNYWTTNNISVTSGTTYDSMTDVPTLTSATVANYCVLNPVAYNSSTISDGNLLFAGSSGTNARTTFAMPSSGSFYWEVKPTTTMPNYVGFGLLIDTCSSTATAGSGATGLWGIYPGGTLYTSINSTITNTSISTPALGCTFAVAYDCTTGKAWFGYAASGAGSITWIGGGSPSAGTSPTTTISTTSSLFAFLSSNDTTSNKSAINFGQQPFAYTPPTGYIALNTYNI